MLLPLLLACPAEPLPRVVASVPAPEQPRVIELVLDRGHFDDAGWTSEPTTDAVIHPSVQQVGDRAIAMLSDGDYAAVIQRSCGRVEVPFAVAADTTVVSLPYPRCGAPAPDGLWTGADLAALQTLDLFLDWPPSPPTSPAVWASSANANAACAWYGNDLPAEPPDHLDGHATWLTDERVVGDDWLIPTSIPAVARDHRVGVVCTAHRRDGGL